MRIFKFVNNRFNLLVTAGLVAGGAARAATGRGAGGARIPELAPPPPPPLTLPLPNGLKKADNLKRNKKRILTYCPSRAATGS